MGSQWRSILALLFAYRCVMTVLADSTSSSSSGRNVAASAATATYTALLDGAGELVAACADMALFDSHLATGPHREQLL